MSFQILLRVGDGRRAAMRMTSRPGNVMSRVFSISLAQETPSHCVCVRAVCGHNESESLAVVRHHLHACRHVVARCFVIYPQHGESNRFRQLR